MTVYLLTRINFIEYDEYDAKVIVSTSELKAREIANEHTGDEGQIWNDEDKVKCELISLDTEGVVLESFNAG